MLNTKQKITEINNLLAELKTAIEDLKKSKATEQPTNHWSIGACVIGVLGLGISSLNLVNKESQAKEEKLGIYDEK